MRFAAAVTAIVGCAGSSTAAQPSSCWPIDESTQSGIVEVGFGGNGSWEPMPASIQFQNGNQGGTLLMLDARVKDLAPGDPDDVFAPGNPRTLITVVLFDGTIVGAPCPSRVPYVPSADGWSECAAPQAFPFLPYAVGQKAFDTDVHIIAEVIDARGHHARDEVTVHAAAPTFTASSADAQLVPTRLPEAN
jgi:hypothetical protein